MGGVKPGECGNWVLVAVSFQSKPSEICWQFARFSEGTQQGCAGAAVAKVAGDSDCDNLDVYMFPACRWNF
jgi:hypothetical protein